MTQTAKQKWISDETWMCTGHVPAPHLPAVQDACWYCGAARPPIANRKIKPPVLFGETEPTPEAKRVAREQQRIAVASEVEKNNAVGIEPCAWPGCPNKASGKSKYCSRNCSNKNARSRYKRPSKSGTIPVVGIDLAASDSHTVVSTVLTNEDGVVSVSQVALPTTEVAE